jgi:hypothetical protein
VTRSNPGPKRRPQRGGNVSVLGRGGRGVRLIVSTLLLTAPDRYVEKFSECIHRLVRCRLVEFEAIAWILDRGLECRHIEPLIRIGINNQSNPGAFTGTPGHADIAAPAFREVAAASGKLIAFADQD